MSEHDPRGAWAPLSANDTTAPLHAWSPPRPPRRPWRPVAALAAAVALIGAGVAVGRVTRSDDPSPAAASPSATAAPVRPPAPDARPSTTPPVPRPATPVRTYTAPPDGIPVTGSVVDMRGRPVANAKVTLTRHEGIIEGIGRGLTVIASLGFACAADVQICQVPYGTGMTNARGEYTVFLKNDVDDYDLNIEGSGLQVQGRIDFAGAPLRLPRLRMWSPAPKLTISGRTARIDFAPVPGSLGPVKRYNAVVSDAQTGVELVVIRSVQDGETFDARLLEDKAVRLRLTALVQSGIGNTWYAGHTTARSGQRPPSRGKACVEYGPGTRTARNTAACRRVVDGSFSTRWDKGHPECPPKGSCDQLVGVDLGAVRTLRLVRVLGCWDQPEVSVDGRTWRTLEPYDGGCVYETSTRARYVRTRDPFGDHVVEISVWY